MGCGTCVAVCLAGGEKEVGLLASEAALRSKLEGKPWKVGEATIERQCDREFFGLRLRDGRSYDAILSMACGAGVQFLAEVLNPSAACPL